jgi:hypothetical protein
MIFYATRGDQKYCPDCREFRFDDIRRHRRKLRAEKKKRGPIKTIDEIIHDADEYNRKHGTSYTYGQYVMKLEHGWLKE